MFTLHHLDKSVLIDLLVVFLSNKTYGLNFYLFTGCGCYWLGEHLLPLLNYP